MTREIYIQHKKNNNTQIIYEYYREKFDSNKHKPLLSSSDFNIYMNMFNADVNSIYKNTLAYYDTKFNIITLMNSNGVIINYI